MSSIQAWATSVHIIIPQRGKKGSLMRTLEETFSEEAILWELCKARCKLAKKRHDRMFLHRISRDAPNGQTALKEIEKLFPGRSQWRAFRPRNRDGSSAFSINVKTLFRAVKALQKRTPLATWAVALQETIKRIRYRALDDPSFAFKPPQIIPLQKTPNGKEYRPLSIFALEDKIIDCLAARFFRRLVDPVLLPSCLAFRCGSKVSPPPDIHFALNKIIRLNRRNRRTGMYVAECDIKSFFDCVSHSYARQSLQQLLAQTTNGLPSGTGTERAWEIFEAYLACYSFDRSVLSSAQPRLKQKDPDAFFKWPVEEIAAFHGGLAQLASVDIGVPQGGALSCLIANTVLHIADKRQAEMAKRLKKSITYMRYCDDMIILTRNKKACEASYEAYLQTLDEICLPAHPPQVVKSYSKAFWSNKSNSPYHWGKLNLGSEVPWIQFVGYQIRHDGLVRVRPKSLKKQRSRITQATDALLKTLNPGRSRRGEVGPFAPGLRKNEFQIFHRFRMQLMSISVGRFKRGMERVDPMPMCWANGFRGLRGQKLIKGMFKILDRHRERQLKRIRRRLDSIPEIQAPRKKEAEKYKKAKVEAYYGCPYSYFGQFQK